MKICLLIPAYNEAENLKLLLPGLKRYNLDMAVVDDGSKDETAIVSNAAGAIVLRHERNLGKGQALQTGFNFILAQGYEAVITLDADGQHDALDVPKFLAAYELDKAGIILGDRMADTADMPLLRLWTNRLTSGIISLLTNCRLRDTQSGFRLIRRKVLEEVRLSTSRFDTESEILIKAARHGFSIRAIPIRTLYFKNSRSKIKPWLDTVRFFKLVFRAVFIWKN